MDSVAALVVAALVLAMQQDDNRSENLADKEGVERTVPEGGKHDVKVGPARPKNQSLHRNAHLASDSSGNQESVWYYLPQKNGREVIYIKEQPFRRVQYLVMDRESIEVDGTTVEMVQPRKEEYLVPVTTY